MGDPYRKAAERDDTETPLIGVSNHQILLNRTIDTTAVECRHPRVTSEVCDQTLGVKCLDCRALLAFCWMDDHIPESLWNRACENDDEAVPCAQNRDSHCALCGEPTHQSSGGDQ